MTQIGQQLAGQTNSITSNLSSASQRLGEVETKLAESDKSLSSIRENGKKASDVLTGIAHEEDVIATKASEKVKTDLQLVQLKGDLEENNRRVSSIVSQLEKSGAEQVLILTSSGNLFKRAGMAQTDISHLDGVDNDRIEVTLEATHSASPAPLFKFKVVNSGIAPDKVAWQKRKIDRAPSLIQLGLPSNEGGDAIYYLDVRSFEFKSDDGGYWELKFIFHKEQAAQVLPPVDSKSTSADIESNNIANK